MASRAWTAAEDAQLTGLVTAAGAGDWAAKSRAFRTDRAPAALRLHWAAIAPAARAGSSAAAAAAASEEPVYEVATVLDRRTGAGSSVEYRVRWLGFGEADDTWEPEPMLSSASAKVAEYERAQVVSRGAATPQQGAKVITGCEPTWIGQPIREEAGRVHYGGFSLDGVKFQLGEYAYLDGGEGSPMIGRIEQLFEVTDAATVPLNRAASHSAAADAT